MARGRRRVQLRVPYLDTALGSIRCSTASTTMRVELTDAENYTVARARSPFPPREVPSWAQLRDQFMGTGALEIRNATEMRRDLAARSQSNAMAGDRPRYWVVDTNLLQFQFVTRLDRWREAYDRAHRAAPLTVGWCIPKGVLTELQTGWHNIDNNALHQWTGALPARDRRSLREHFFNQSDLRTRLQRIGHAEYFRAANAAYIEHPDCNRGDESIIAALVARQKTEARRYIVLTNDSGMVERCRGRGLWSIHVKRPLALPQRLEVPFDRAAQLFWTLAVVYGMIELDGVGIVAGIWLGKDVAHWQRREVRVRPARMQLQQWLDECAHTLRGSAWGGEVKRQE